MLGELYHIIQFMKTSWLVIRGRRSAPETHSLIVSGTDFCRGHEISTI